MDMLNRITRRGVALVGALLVCLIGLASGQSLQYSSNGKDWLTPTPHERVAYVDGFSHGYMRALADAVAESKGRDALLEFPDGMTNDQLEATVTAFYRDYRNVAVCWPDAVAFSIRALAGHPATEDDVNAVRAKDARVGCVPR